MLRSPLRRSQIEDINEEGKKKVPKYKNKPFFSTTFQALPNNIRKVLYNSQRVDF